MVKGANFISCVLLEFLKIIILKKIIQIPQPTVVSENQSIRWCSLELSAEALQGTRMHPSVRGHLLCHTAHRKHLESKNTGTQVGSFTRNFHKKYKGLLFSC